MTKIYIAGKVSGLAYIDLTHKFGSVEKILTQQGYQVINPLNIVLGGEDWEPAMRKCIKALCSCEEIYMLHDWRLSPGAKLEHHIAQQLKLRIHYGEAPGTKRVK